MTAVASIIDPSVTATRPLGPWANGLLMSPEEFDAAKDWDDLYRYELVNGVLIVSELSEPMVSAPNDWLGYWVRRYREEHDLGKTMAATIYGELICLPNSRRRVDRAIWCGLDQEPRNPRPAPTIAVDFVTGETKDRKRDFAVKRREYAAAGVREYWIVDRFRRQMAISRGEELQIVAESEVYRTTLMPGFELLLRELLAKCDHWDNC